LSGAPVEEEKKLDDDEDDFDEDEEEEEEKDDEEKEEDDDEDKEDDSTPPKKDKAPVKKVVKLKPSDAGLLVCSMRETAKAKYLPEILETIKEHASM